MAPASSVRSMQASTSLGELLRQDVPDVASDQLLRRAHELGRVVRPGRRGRCRHGHADHRVGDRVEQGAVAPLDPLHRLERALVGEREAGGGADGVEQLGAQAQRAVVDERADRLALVQDRRRDRASPGPGSASGLPLPVDVARRRRRRAELERRVAERPPERVLEVGRLRRARAARRGARRPPPRDSRPCRSMPRNAAGRASAARRPSPKPATAAPGRERREHEPEREEQQAILPPISTGTSWRRAAGVAARARRDEHDARPRARSRPRSRPRAPRARSRATACESTSARFARMVAVVARERVEQDGERLEHEHVGVGDGDERRGRVRDRAGRSGRRAARARAPRRRDSSVSTPIVYGGAPLASCSTLKSDAKADGGEEQAEAGVRRQPERDHPRADEREADDRGQRRLDDRIRRDPARRRSRRRRRRSRPAPSSAERDGEHRSGGRRASLAQPRRRGRRAAWPPARSPQQPLERGAGEVVFRDEPACAAALDQRAVRPRGRGSRRGRSAAPDDARAAARRPRSR